MRERLLDWLLTWLEARKDRRYADAPFGSAPLAPAEEYRRRWADVKARTYPPIDAYEQASGAAIDPAWLHQLALLTQITIKKSDLCYQHGRLLYARLRRYARERTREHLTIVETGTARGFSALCMAKALSDAGASGTIVTFDVLPHDVAMFWNCVRDEEGPRTRAQLLVDYAELIERHLLFHRGDTARELSMMSFPRIHMAMLDSVHTYDHVMAEYDAIRGRQRPGDVLFFDDYTSEAYPGVVQAADEICERWGYRPDVVSATPARRYLIAEKT